MDILDIDEALKDDSFIFLEDKTHDDVSNILQQWKSNNCLPTQQQQTQQQQHEQVYKLNSRTFTRPKRKLAQNLESQFFNTSYTNGPHNYQNQQQQQQQQQQYQNGAPMLNLEIGGLVTTMHKSFLQDTSPPSSICSSMDISVDGGGGQAKPMNNSLITSADFTNINFLQSTQSLDFNDRTCDGFFNLTDKTTSDGYTLSDMIRDREALESLTMSGDGTLIKDSHIAQIDDISLALSKTASGCSTMDNSTESVEVGGINNRTVELANRINSTYDSGAPDERNFVMEMEVETADDVMHRTMLLSEEMIGDTTFNLVENSIYAERIDIGATVDAENRAEPVALNLNLTHDISIAVTAANETFKKPPQLDETIFVSSGKGNGANTTFDCKTPDARCETPENTADRQAVANKFYESTPQTTNVRRLNKLQYTPSIQTADDVNISPIVAPSRVTAVLNETYEPLQKTTIATCNNKSKLNTNTFCGALPHFEESMELLENIEQPNETFNKSCHQQQEQQRRQLEQSAAGIEMQNVMNLAQAEAELLADCDNYAGDEEQFEHMLDEFGRVEISAEQLKMRQSLDTIKKRFNYGVCIGSGATVAVGNKSAGEREISREARDMRELMHISAPDEQRLTTTERPNLNVTMEIRNEELRKLKESMRESRELKASKESNIISDLRTSTTSSMLNSKEFIKELRDSSTHGLTSSTLSSASVATSGHERLLSRRSRLYDDINLSTLSGVGAAAKTPSSPFEDAAVSAETKAETELSGEVTSPAEKSVTVAAVDEEKTEEEMEIKNAAVEAAAAYKLAEKRERDRDRFKTIKIIKPRATTTGVDGMGGGVESGPKLNVPCIDNDIVDNDFSDANVEAPTSQLQSQRYSRRDERTSTSPPADGVFNNNKSEVEAPPSRTKTNTNYLTYKKPKEKTKVEQQQRLVLPEAPALPSQEAAVAGGAPKSRLEPRSLSRPRFISGLQKFSVVSKATSAGDLEKTMTSQAAAAILQQSNASKTAATVNSNFNRTQPNVGVDKMNSGNDLKSPMGIKSKSFHNLSSNFGYPSGGGGGMTATKTNANALGLRRQNNASGGGILTEKQAKANPMRANGTAAITTNGLKTEDSVFKVPKLVSGIRAPGPAGAAKRAGLVRPSSGYYSLTVTAKAGIVPQANDLDSDTGRHSPTDSMSSASSRSSVQSGCTGLKQHNSNSSSNFNLPLGELNLTKVTTGSTGIPKPSGLRPPSNIKRSGLPRPSSLVRR